MNIPKLRMWKINPFKNSWLSSLFIFQLTKTISKKTARWRRRNEEWLRREEKRERRRELGLESSSDEEDPFWRTGIIPTYDAGSSSSTISTPPPSSELDSSPPPTSWELVTIPGNKPEQDWVIQLQIKRSRRKPKLMSHKWYSFNDETGKFDTMSEDSP